MFIRANDLICISGQHRAGRLSADAAETGKRISKVKYKTKNLKPWNLADISKAKQGYAYHSTVGKPLEQIENANYILLDEVYEVEAGKQYTVYMIMQKKLFLRIILTLFLLQLLYQMAELK